MASEKMGYDPEKGHPSPEYNDVGIGEVRQGPVNHKLSLTGRKSSVVKTIVAADLLDDRYATTQRGLKSRHAQMIALGGTIGTGYVKAYIILLEGCL